MMGAIRTPPWRTMTPPRKQSSMSWIAVWQARARQLKTDTYVLYLAYRDPRTPWYARLFTVAVVAYALSPIDLIPDFVPIFGYVDDLILVPLGLALALRMIPGPVMAECRTRAQIAIAEATPLGKIGAAVIIVIWLLGAASVGVLVGRRLVGD
jgi:uncharacterized membrane protein YkvA (DUF1232 family)